MQPDDKTTEPMGATEQAWTDTSAAFLLWRAQQGDEIEDMDVLDQILLWADSHD